MSDSHNFVEVGPGFVALQIRAENFLAYLKKLKLIRPKKSDHRKSSYEWKPEFLEFLKEQGYAGDVRVTELLRNDGLILRRDQAIIMRLRFL